MIYIDATMMAAVAALVVTALVAVCVAVATLPAARRVARAASAAGVTEPGEEPPVSVVVVADGEADNLDSLLGHLAAQEYGGAWEVVVVYGGDNAEVEDIVARRQREFTRIYLTFAPRQARNISRRKLAITLGVKAAQFDRILLTESSCAVGTQWLRNMSAGFRGGKSVVVGYAYYEEGNSVGRSLSFQRLSASVQSLNCALKGMAYRADIRNMGIERALFERSKGFSAVLHLIDGEDDVWLGEVTRRGDCGVALCPEAMVAVAADDVRAAMRGERLRRAFTATMLRRGPQRARGLRAQLWWLWLLASAGTAALSLFTAWYVLLPVLTVLNTALCLWCGAVWRRAGRMLHLRAPFLTLPWLMLMRPWVHLRMLRSEAYRHAVRYNWQM